MPDNTIHVAYALNDGYAEYTCISMTSLLCNTPRPVRFHILESRLSEENKRILCDITRTYPHGAVEIHHVDNIRRVFKEEVHTLWTNEAWFRLFLPELLPDVDRVLYLDGDTVVRSDISELYDWDLGDNAAAVCADIGQGNSPAKYRLLGLARSELTFYFNSGVILMNLVKLRKFGLVKKSLAVIPELRHRHEKEKTVFYCDQDTLNVVLKDEIVYFPLKFNCLISVYNYYICGDGVVALDEFAEALAAPVIVHYRGDVLRQIKRLDGFLENPFWDDWYKYRNLTAFADPADDAKVLRYKEWFASLDTKYDGKNCPNYRVWIAAKRYSIFAGLAEVIAPLIHNREDVLRKVVVWQSSVNMCTRLLCIMLAMKGIRVSAVAHKTLTPVTPVTNQSSEPKIGVSATTENSAASEPGAAPAIEQIFECENITREQLYGKSNEYFVLLNIEREAWADKAKDELREHGYTDDDFCFVYEDAYKKINTVFARKK